MEINEKLDKVAISDAWKTPGSAAELRKKDGRSYFIHDPFRCFALTDFLRPPKENYFESLLTELGKVDMRSAGMRRDNDLFQFHQSSDLANIDKTEFPVLADLRDWIYKDLKAWMASVTSFKLTDKVSLTISEYGPTDVLLCHDDKLQGRKIAFVLYLSRFSFVPLIAEDWLDEYGGHLDLFASDANGNPTHVSQSILPNQNTLSFFEVAPGSHHQVREVQSHAPNRLSINGWFYSEEAEPEYPKWAESGPPESWVKDTTVDMETFLDWINPTYLTEAAQKDAKAEFEETSELAFENFLNADKYAELCNALGKAEWNLIGPPNRRHYYTAAASTPALCTLQNLFASDAMHLLLSQLTGVPLHSFFRDDDSGGTDNGAETSKSETAGCSEPKRPRTQSEGNTDARVTAKCRMQLRRWKAGCYTLLHDPEKTVDAKPCLDLLMQLSPTDTAEDWEPDVGGYTCYIAADDALQQQENAAAGCKRDRNPTDSDSGSETGVLADVQRNSIESFC